MTDDEAPLIDGKWADEVWAACAVMYEAQYGEPATAQDEFLNMVREGYRVRRAS